MTEPLRFISRDIDLNGQFENVPRTTVIAIAAVATVFVIALVAGCVFLCIRRRSRRNKANRHGESYLIDRNANSQHDPVSKTPLMRQENLSQTPQSHGVPAPRYDGEDDIAMAEPLMPHRALSGRSMQSLPPSYTVATHASIARTMSQNSHKPDSIYSGSDGLRPLMLLSTTQSHDGNDQDMSEGRGRPGYPTDPNRLSLVLPRPVGRPRSGSRFREEDLDM